MVSKKLSYCLRDDYRACILAENQLASNCEDSAHRSKLCTKISSVLDGVHPETQIQNAIANRKRMSIPDRLAVVLFL